MEASEQKAIKTAIQQWFNQLEKAVNNVDYDFARAHLFAEDVVSFGTKADKVMFGLGDVVTKQWERVWPSVKDFAFDDNLHLWAFGENACGVITWRSKGVKPDGAFFDRAGRATVIFEQRGGRWLAVHTHFSLVPGT